MINSDTLLSDYATETEAAAELRCHPRTLVRWRALRIGPPHTKLGGRILYRRGSIKAWLASLESRDHPARSLNA